jgi:chromosome segregation ATPase
MLTSEKALVQLEAHLTQVVRLLSSLQGENRNLREEIQRLGTDLEEVKKDNKAKDQLIKQLKDDRLRIRAGVEKIMKKVTTLEEPLG